MKLNWNFQIGGVTLFRRGDPYGYFLGLHNMKFESRHTFTY